MIRPLVVVLVALAVFVGCTPSVAPSPTPLSAHDLAVAKAQAKLDELAATNAAAPITDAMRAAATVSLDADSTLNATFALDAAIATFALDPDDPTFDVEQKVSSTKVRLLSDLLFAFGSASLSAAASARITKYAATIPPDATVTVDGHTDSIGSASSNMTLSKKRANAVAAVLRKARPDLRVAASGHGEADPVVPNQTVDGKDDPIARAQNRRVEVSYRP